MIALETTEAWNTAYPDALIGVLEIAQVDNATPAPALEAEKRRVEKSLRAKYADQSRAQLIAAPVLGDYVRYYKRFEKTYHVLLQLESVALKGKGLPAVSPLVDANFAAELETLVLTAGHDAAKLQPPLFIADERGNQSNSCGRHGDARCRRNVVLDPVRTGQSFGPLCLLDTRALRGLCAAGCPARGNPSSA